MKKSSLVASLVLLLVAGLTVLFSFGTLNTKLDYDFEKFFPDEDPDTQFYESHRKQFSTENDFVLVGIRNDAGVYQAGFLERVDSLIEDIKTVENVTAVRSILSEKKVVFNQKTPYLDLNRPDSLWFDSIWISKTPDVLGNWVAENGKTLSIFVKHDDYLSAEKCNFLSRDLEEIEAKYSFDEIHMAGRAVGQTYYTTLMLTELQFFAITSLVLLVLFLLIAFRSFWGVIVPIIVVILSVVWTLGLMGLVNQPINLVLTMLPTILFVVGMSDVVHIVSKYLEELRNGKSKLKALGITIKEVGMATLLTSITTAIGFFTLMTSSIVPIQEFGLYTGIGVMLAFVLAFLIMPSILALMPQPKRVREKKENLFWKNALNKSFLFTIRKQGLVLVVSAILLGVAGVGISKIQVNNYLLEDLRDDDPMRANFVFFEEEFSGVRPFELSVKSKDSTSLITLANIQLIDSLERIIQEVYPIQTIISPLTGFRAANRVMESGMNVHYVLPSSKRNFKKAKKRIEKIGEEQWRKFVSKDETTIRMTATVADLGGQKFRALNGSFDSIVAERLPELTVRQTGTAFLIDKNNKYLSTSMMQSLLIAFGVIALIVGLIYKSVKMVLISLVPNVLPLLLIAAFMGFTGIDITVSTSIIFTIAFGIAVDDTIHFISKLKLELNKGKSLAFAVRRTYMSTGRAIVLTSTILCAGFLTLVFSAFLGTFNVGLLITLTLIFAVLSDLFLLPILILKLYGNKKASIKEA